MAAVLHGGKQIPLWLAVLMASEAWGVPPWVIEDHDPVWFIRWLEWKKLQAKKAKKDEQVRNARSPRRH